MSDDDKRHDNWLKDDSEAAALTMRQRLLPVEGEDAVIFPPTYPIDQNRAGYNIDRLDDGSSVCQIDSVGSQANRMEPLFKKEKYKHLVPQVVITAGERTIHLLDAGHRAADAIVRFSTLGPDLHEAFRAYRDDGNAEPLARIAPTSIVFGSWDSRATQVKLPRIVRSVIRAYNVRELTRSAQYSTIAGEILVGGGAEVATKGPKAELGLAHVPAVKTHGGVQLQGANAEIRREAILNFAALRAVAGPSDDETLKVRRYVLGLALVSFTAPMDSNLREGCELVSDPKEPAAWKLVEHDGTRTDLVITHEQALAFATVTSSDPPSADSLVITHEQALAFATSAAASFGVGADKTGSFESDLATKVLNLSEDDRKKLLRQGPVTREAIDQLETKGAKAKSAAEGKK